MSNNEPAHMWQFIIRSEQLDDGSWRAWLPTRDWSTFGATEQEARDRGVNRAIELGEDADEVVRNMPRSVIEFEEDDPRIGWVWRFAPQTEQFSDGTWRAWFASGGWTVTGSTEQDAIDKADVEWFRRREDPDEIARRIATMRRHLVEPVPGFQNTPSSVLAPAWDDPNPAQAVRAIIEGLDKPS
jgi:hypothetical protein